MEAPERQPRGLRLQVLQADLQQRDRPRKDAVALQGPQRQSEIGAPGVDIESVAAEEGGAQEIQDRDIDRGPARLGKPVGDQPAPGAQPDGGVFAAAHLEAPETQGLRQRQRAGPGLYSVDRAVQRQFLPKSGKRYPASPAGWVFRKFVLPRAARVVLPTLCNYLISLFKDTAICSVATMQELMSAGQIVAARNAQCFTVYTAPAILLRPLLSLRPHGARPGGASAPRLRQAVAAAPARSRDRVAAPPALR